MLPDIKARYTARARSAWLIEAKDQGGNNQVAVTFEVVEGDYAGEYITWTGTFAPGKATDITLKALQSAMGWAGDDISELADVAGSECEALLPNVVELACEMDTYNDETRLKVRWVNAPGGARFGNPLAGDSLKRFAAQMRGTIRSAAGPQRARPPAQRPAAAATRDAKPETSAAYGGYPPGDAADEDIPF
jgi:hypothetical protein